MKSIRDGQIKYISTFFEQIYNGETVDKIISLLDVNNTYYTINNNGIFLNLNTINDILLTNIYDIIKGNHIDIDEESYMCIIEDKVTTIKEYFTPTPDNVSFTKIDSFLLNLSNQHLTI
jgi:hypothetical protein|tara:strand:- start:282 stop:638 length:357 start_codon:yes stop_codon:yes gene_type:complete